MREATITISGQRLTEAQSMTIRVAIENFAVQLYNEGLGDDDTGKSICNGYLARIGEIRAAIKLEAR